MDNETLVQTIEALEVAANTVQRCYTHRPGNFAYALQELETQATAARELVTQYRKRYPHMAWNDPPLYQPRSPYPQRLTGTDSEHQRCAHDHCTECHGTGINRQGLPCIHGLVCTCRRCNNYSLAR